MHVTICASPAVMLLCASLTPALGAQQPVNCAALRSQLLAAVNSPDSVVVYAALRPARRDAVLPRWYLQAALTEIISRYPASGVQYDPLLDVRIPVTVTARQGARASAVLGEREIVATTLSDAPTPKLGTLTARISGASIAGRTMLAPLPDGAEMMMDSARQAQAEKDAIVAAERNRPAPVLAASATSVLTHLASAVAAAQRDSAFPPMPEGSGDSISLVLELRPRPGSRLALADSGTAVLPLFRAANLHRVSAADALYDGEVDVGAQLERRSRFPRWPSDKKDAQGGVLMEIVVDTTGRVDPAQLRVLEATQGFSAAVLEAARTWRYTPAQVAGCPVRSVISEAVFFRQFGQ